ncbi:aldo/keto reductase [Paraglaciecola chathamensis]|jgi:predicted oxidoreductase|uniref:Aldo/keto reductase n=3 Tax=Paraglaciecola chathamensis TaxID=368405 RepID=A0A8H9M6N1_9ALTE|nr:MULTISPECIES: aldo/keto reductase [Paraglaciecola]MBN23937.1 aldo/keto reductase [Alteromonadaceae bacterium]GAC05949.1 aldo/keto reductase [Paraglaciecola agarilytica NO2]GAC09579.1 aldo/keto reductase [Paraglaciecola chathamensis S18K6]GGZ82490.1 aldo/keto reductase [Paraglaciecola oceanifecundans]|tara:strand:- start:10570 stop:11547 length:978 start_codon:yes stop_codon:yes gene_type:complete
MTYSSLPLANYLPNVSSLAYGCMGLGGDWSDAPITQAHIEQANDCVNTALESGINFFDHADIYTHGKAEQVFGKVLSERPELRKQIYIQSKCGIRFADDKGPKRYDLSSEWIKASVEGSLQRLNTDYLDVLMLHRPDPLMQPEDIASAFTALKREGKVHHFAVSNMQHHQISFLQKALDEPLVANQIEASLLQQHWIDEGVYAGNTDGRDINFTAGTLEYCRQEKIQLQSWGSLAQGLYSGRDVSDQPEAVQRTSQLVAKLASLYQTSPEAIVLAWLLRHPAQLQPVIGTTDCARIAASCQAMNIQLNREHWYALYESAKGHELP